MTDIKNNNKVIYVIGVSGSGKTLIGQRLAVELGVPFVDADDYHPKSNIEKMGRGIALSDKDRMPWLDELIWITGNQFTKGCVLACSALKEKYRYKLMNSISQEIIWIYLKGSFEIISKRINKRKNHFMGVNLLHSQFDVLEEPKDAITVDVSNSPDEIIREIKRSLNVS